MVSRVVAYDRRSSARSRWYSASSAISGATTSSSPRPSRRSSWGSEVPGLGDQVGLGLGDDLGVETHSYAIKGEDRQRSVLVPDHAAPFALVRWTNVFFPHTGVMHGDPVGGPLQPAFGEWIADVPLPHPGGGFAGLAHTKYVDISRRRAHADQLRRARNLEVRHDIASWLSRAQARAAAAAEQVEERVAPPRRAVETEESRLGALTVGHPPAPRIASPLDLNLT